MEIRDILDGGACKRDLAEALRARLTVLRAQALAEADGTLASWRRAVTRQEFLPSVENLALYLSLRKLDLTVEQEALTALGLSSLGRSEAHVLGSLDAVIAALTAMVSAAPVEGPVHRDKAAARDRIGARRDAIFGTDVPEHTTRILVTLPSEAATDPDLVTRLIAAGGSTVRINCAHDAPEDWAKMIAHTRAAAEAVGRRVPILMDLAGPKVRTRDMSIPADLLAREKKKKLKHLKEEGLELSDLGGRLMRGDRMVLADTLRADERLFTVTLSHPELLDQLKPGAMVWFDDGKIGAHVEAVEGRRAELEVLHAPAKGARLKAEKGVNLPGVAVDIPALTDADRNALDFVVGRADIIGYSFVQTARDVRGLQEAIAARLPEGAAPPAIILKIETDLAVRNLPRLIVQAGGRMPVAVMIARGDLAVEIGLERLSEIQEEILWLCEAAEVPVVWATQVLEGLCKDGFASRAETTDAAMGQRAECVMLNKGPYAEEAVAFLARVLRRMNRHQSKKSPRLAPLRAWREPEGL
ncbi:pyruvate kinase [Pseudoruegeria sp. HB172150]|uniref:pyruvate kinase n=1 Tax=Pseudoruegeria sp. HB172150 TaxID=2721164 RepID=UPI00155241F5|nr:pyruvate kinase [Pseudoruegeria sp. HB172150]